MPQRCPDCGSNDALSFVPEFGQQVCSDCGAVPPELLHYEPSSRLDISYALGGPADGRVASSPMFHVMGPVGKPFWVNSLEESRRRNEYFRKPEVDARIQGTLNTLGHPHLFPQVVFLFQRARHESWREETSSELVDHIGTKGGSSSPANTNRDPHLTRHLPPSLTVRRVRWGQDSFLLATACCYTILRRRGVHIDLQTVSDAAQLSYPKVRSAFKLLRLLVKDAVRDVQLSNPDPYIRRLVAFFQRLAAVRSSVSSAKVSKFLAPLRSQTSTTSASDIAIPVMPFANTAFEAVEATALDLCRFWWPRRDTYASSPHLAAFAAVILALEIQLKALAPVYEIFRHVYSALESDPNKPLSSDDTGDELVSKRAILFYGQICTALRSEAAAIPWLTGIKPVSRNARQKATQARVTDLVRKDLIVHATDILALWKATPPNHDRMSHVRRSMSPSGDSHLSLASGNDHQMRSETTEDTDTDLRPEELDIFVAAGTHRFGDDQNDVGQTQADESAVPPPADEEIWPRIKENVLATLGTSVVSAGEHPLDRLSDEQVDQLLFDDGEMLTLLRTDPTERAALERVKLATGDWSITPMEPCDTDFSEPFAEAGNRPAPKVSMKRSASRAPSESSKIGKDKRRKPASSAVKPLHKAESVPAFESIPCSSSLQEQLEESDWSD